MSPTENARKVAAIVEAGQVQQQIRTALESDPELTLELVLETPENAAQRIYSAAPDLILMDERMGGEDTLDLVDELALKLPEAPLLAMLGTDDSTRAQQFLLAGARAFLVKPFTQVNLLSAIRRVEELEARRRVIDPAAEQRQPDRAGPLQILTVYSPRGGVGSSTIAVNLAVALNEKLDARVLLMEGKLSFGHLGLMLNTRPQNTIADLLPHAGALDDGLVEEVVSKHSTGIHILLSSSDLNVSQGVRPNDLYGVIQAVSRSFDIIVIDAGSHLDDNTVTLMDAADRVLLITTPDLAALHDTSRFIQLARGLGFHSNKVLAVLNRVGVRGGIKVKEIESALHQSLFARISEGDARVMRSLNRGVPLVYSASRSPVSKDIYALAERLSGMRRGAEAPGSASDGQAAERSPNGKERRARRAALRMVNR